MNWYYARGDERIGPLDDAQFEELIASGTIHGNTLVWREGMADWASLSEINLEGAAAGMVAASAGDYATRSCTECGKTFPADELVAYEGASVCAACKPYFFQRLRESGAMPGEMRYGGFWIRFVAYVIDGIILGIVGIPLSILQNRMLLRQVGTDNPDLAELSGAFGIFGIFWVLSILIGMAYYGYFVGRFAATPGKMVFGLRIVVSDGGRVSYARAIGRYFGTMLSSMTLLIGFIIAAFDDQKRALHDHICDTRVVYK